IAAVEQHLAPDDAPGGRNEPHERERRHALSAAGLSHEPEDAARFDAERYAVHRARLATLDEERRPEVAHLGKRHQERSGAGAASSGSTRDAGGGVNTAPSTGAFVSTASYVRRAAGPGSAATSSTCGNPSR